MTDPRDEHDMALAKERAEERAERQSQEQSEEESEEDYNVGETVLIGSEFHAIQVSEEVGMDEDLNKIEVRSTTHGLAVCLRT